MVFCSKESIDQKRDLTDIFIRALESKDSLIDQISARTISEPLAVTLGQMKFQEHYFPDNFDVEGGNWYNHNFINDFSIILYPLVSDYIEQNRRIDHDFMKQTADLLSNFLENQRRKNINKNKHENN